MYILYDVEYTYTKLIFIHTAEPSKYYYNTIVDITLV